MDACLTKPVEPARLSEVVEAHGAAGRRASRLRPAPARVSAIASHPGFRRAAPPPLDPQVLASLEALGGGDFLAGLVGDFLRDGEASLRALEAAAGRGDVSRFRAEAHALQERRREHRRQGGVARLPRGRGPPCPRSAERRPLASWTRCGPSSIGCGRHGERWPEQKAWVRPNAYSIIPDTVLKPFP